MLCKLPTGDFTPMDPFQPSQNLHLKLKFVQLIKINTEVYGDLCTHYSKQ